MRGSSRLLLLALPVLLGAGGSARLEPPLTWVDLSASGCPTYEAEGPTCRGPVPLTLRFTAISPAAIETYAWSFGDGNTATEASPLHTYRTAGIFDVMLTVGAAGGTAKVERNAFVVVDRGPPGSPCSTDSECQTGLTCFCGGGDGCPPSLAAGVCARPCDPPSPSCEAGTACAHLSTPGQTTAGWRRPLCLEECSRDGDCRGDFRCRELRSGSGAGWLHACFAPDLLADDGASCMDAAGLPDATRCAGGACASFGARGECASVCGGDAGCPSYADCAQFAGGPQCLARCSNRDCSEDPWLACEAPDASGGLGFTVDVVPPAAGYCAPERCTGDGDCGLEGTCAQGVGGFCTGSFLPGQ